MGNDERRWRGEGEEGRESERERGGRDKEEKGEGREKDFSPLVYITTNL